MVTEYKTLFINGEFMIKKIFKMADNSESILSSVETESFIENLQPSELEDFGTKRYKIF